MKKRLNIIICMIMIFLLTIGNVYAKPSEQILKDHKEYEIRILDGDDVSRTEH